MQGFYTEPEKKVPVFGTYDVIVCGGGVAGFSAALASARNGAKTLIIEQYPFFGGTATASLMINLVGFRNQVPPDDKQVTRGIGEELMLRLIARGGARHSLNAYPSPFRSDTKGDLSYNYVVDSEMFKHEMLMMLKDAGVSILFHTYVADTIVEDGRVKGVLIENKSGRQAVFASVTVDATGDADVAYRAGAGFWQTCREENPRLTDCLMYRIGGFKEGTKAHGCLYGDTMVVWGPSPGAVNCADGKELSDSEVDVRSRIYEDLKEKIAENPDLEGARIVETPVQLGIRQTRFIVGEYQLTGEDVLEGRHFEDQSDHPLLRLPLLPEARRLSDPLPLLDPEGRRRADRRGTPDLRGPAGFREPARDGAHLPDRGSRGNGGGTVRGGESRTTGRGREEASGTAAPAGR